jgi:anti-sigma factor RsiW
MVKGNEKIVDCSRFEELLTDYLDKTLAPATFKAVAEHALVCPLCHSLLNDVKGAINACHQLAEPQSPLTRLEARILASTTPEAAIHCDEFEASLTDYLDGFLPAQVFHRWERHAVLCDECTDLPGTVVRALAAIVSYKLDELPVPAGLHQRILQHTIGTVKAKTVRASWSSRFRDWVGDIRIPISVPQLAPVALMITFAFLFVSQTVSADGSFGDIYTKGFQLAEQTYQQSADAWNGKVDEQPQAQEPITGTTYVEDRK